LSANPDRVNGYGLTGCCRAMFANRISYTFDFNGPSFAIDTACSSSLVALSQAVQAIKSGQCDAAIVGGANLLLKPCNSLQFHRLSMLSPQGMCKAFDVTGKLNDIYNKKRHFFYNHIHFNFYFRKWICEE